MYERFINQLKMYSQASSIKRLFTYFFLTAFKIEYYITRGKEALQVINRDYDLVTKRLYLYYDMKLVTFGIDDQRNLIIQFLLFVLPYTHQHLTLYQMETVPVPIVDENKQVHILYIFKSK